MPFASDDWVKIVQYLGLSIEDKPLIDAAIADIQANYPDVEPAAKSILDQLVEVETNLGSALNSGNYALVRADVLQWESSDTKVAGYYKRAERLMSQLYQLLNLQKHGLTLPEKSTSSGSSSSSICINHGW